MYGLCSYGLCGYGIIYIVMAPCSYGLPFATAERLATIENVDGARVRDASAGACLAARARQCEAQVGVGHAGLGLAPQIGGPSVGLFLETLFLATFGARRRAMKGPRGATSGRSPRDASLEIAVFLATCRRMPTVNGEGPDRIGGRHREALGETRL